ncbi:MAG: hypothetical protein ACFFDR_14015 [Candidatus Thorarchaeota archaeon]
MVEIDSREHSTMQNPMLLRIRQAALDKAFMQIRDRRFELDENRTRGRISEDEYQRRLVQLILEGNEIRVEQKEIESLLSR